MALDSANFHSRVWKYNTTNVGIKRNYGVDVPEKETHVENLTYPTPFKYTKLDVPFCSLLFLQYSIAPDILVGWFQSVLSLILNYSPKSIYLSINFLPWIQGLNPRANKF